MVHNDYETSRIEMIELLEFKHSGPKLIDKHMKVIT